ncbi:unnamed protein product [Urochloa humidicola]
MEQQQEEEEGVMSHVQALPEEMLADVLRRLAPRGLAASRCVCKAWRAAVDGRRLLRADLLPYTLGGLFVDFNMLGHLEFFSASASAPCGVAAVSGDLGFTPEPKGHVADHCNGLLLRRRDVVNPAMRQWSPLPPQPHPRGGRTMAEGFFADPYLVFDPAVSPHYYEVFLMPTITGWAPLDDDDAATAGSEWPPALCETHVFSSATGRWEERSFVRGGEPAGTVAEMKRASTMDKRYGVYWRGALYVHSRNGFMCRVSLADGTYRVIKPPPAAAAENGADDGGGDHRPAAYYLGRSERGVYFATLDRDFRRLRVWILDESSCGHQMEWVLKHQISNLKHVLASQDSYIHQQHDDGDCGWCFQDINHHANLLEDQEDDDGEEEGHVEPTLIDHSYITLLGFHPFREILYFNSNLSIGLAYDLNTCKVQDLGSMRPKYYHMAGQHEYIRASYPYTPCWMENSFTSST